MNTFRSLGLLMGTLILSACQSVPDSATVAAQARTHLTLSQTVCEELNLAKTRPLPLTNEVQKLDTTSQIFNFEDGKAFFDVLELPQYTKPYSITINTIPSGDLLNNAILTPRVKMLTSDFQMTRNLDKEKPRKRGNSLEQTIFINPSNTSERYLLIYGKNIEEAKFHNINTVSTTAIPIILPGMVVTVAVSSGSESKQTVHSSPIGQYIVYTKGLLPEK